MSTNLESKKLNFIFLQTAVKLGFRKHLSLNIQQFLYQSYKVQYWNCQGGSFWPPLLPYTGFKKLLKEICNMLCIQVYVGLLYRLIASITNKKYQMENYSSMMISSTTNNTTVSGHLSSYQRGLLRQVFTSWQRWGYHYIFFPAHIWCELEQLFIKRHHIKILNELSYVQAQFRHVQMHFWASWAKLKLKLTQN